MNCSLPGGCLGYTADMDKLIKRVFLFTKNAYGDNLVSLVLFGSVARGVSRHDSDIDLLIVAEKLPSGRMKRVSEFGEKIENPMEKYLADLRGKGIHTALSPVFKTREEVLSGSPLFLDMIDSSKVLFDRNGFFRNYLEGLKMKLKKLGSRKVVRGTAWYWILKPDYRHGDIIEL